MTNLTIPRFSLKNSLLVGFIFFVALFIGLQIRNSVSAAPATCSQGFVDYSFESDGLGITPCSDFIYIDIQDLPTSLDEYDSGLADILDNIVNRELDRLDDAIASGRDKFFIATLYDEVDGEFVKSDGDSFSDAYRMYIISPIEAGDTNIYFTDDITLGSGNPSITLVPGTPSTILAASDNRRSDETTIDSSRLGGNLTQLSSLAQSVIEDDTEEDLSGRDELFDPDAIAAAAAADAADDEFFESCEGSFIIGWVLCGVIEILYKAIDSFYRNFILTNLVVDPLDGSNANCDPDADECTPEDLIFKAWNNFRIMANVAFIILFLLAIIGQSFSWFLTPYELKKMIPRLAFGAIGIQLSWFFAGFMVDLFNVLGAGVHALILTPVDGLKLEIDFLQDSNSVWDGIADVVSGGAIAATGAIAFKLLGAKALQMTFVMILLPIILLVVTSALVIMFRKMLIYILIITSPIAFVSWVLPNTDGLFKRWMDLFWKSLIMYPIIIALISSGRLVSTVVSNSGLPSTLAVVAGVVSLFAPYLLIPTSFKFAGSVLSNVSNGLRGASGGLKSKIFGDPHAPHSFAHRKKEAAQTNRRERLSNFIDRNKPAMGGLGQGYKAARDKDTGKIKTRKRSGPVGGLVGRTMKGLSQLPGAGLPAGLSRAVGGVAAQAVLRVGPNVAQMLSDHAAQRQKTVANAGGWDAEILMGIVSGKADATNYVTGKQIKTVHGLAATAGGGFAGGENLSEDPGAILNAMLGLTGRLSTEGLISEMFDDFANNHHLTDAQKDQVWDAYTKSDVVKAYHPELRYMGWQKGEDGKFGWRGDTKEEQSASAQNFVSQLHQRKSTARDLPNSRSGMWTALQRVQTTDRDLLGEKSIAQLDELNTWARDATMDGAYQASMTNPRFSRTIQGKKNDRERYGLRDYQSTFDIVETPLRDGRVLHTPTARKSAGLNPDILMPESFIVTTETAPDGSARQSLDLLKTKDGTGLATVFNPNDEITLKTLLKIAPYRENSDAAEAKTEHVAIAAGVDKKNIQTTRDSGSI